MAAGMDAEPAEDDSRMREFRDDLASRMWIGYQTWLLRWLQA